MKWTWRCWSSTNVLPKIETYRWLIWQNKLSTRANVWATTTTRPFKTHYHKSICAILSINNWFRKEYSAMTLLVCCVVSNVNVCAPLFRLRIYWFDVALRCIQRTRRTILFSGYFDVLRCRLFGPFLPIFRWFPAGKHAYLMYGHSKLPYRKNLRVRRARERERRRFTEEYIVSASQCSQFEVRNDLTEFMLIGNRKKSDREHATEIAERQYLLCHSVLCRFPIYSQCINPYDN